jgi:hypothetical protein
VAQAGEALEGPEFEHLVEQEGAGLAAGAARGVEKCQQRVERAAGVDRRLFAARRRCERRRRDHRVEKTFGCRGAPFDVDVLRRSTAGAVAQSLQQVRAAGAASAEHDWNPRGRRLEGALNTSLESSH